MDDRDKLLVFELTDRVNGRLVLGSEDVSRYVRGVTISWNVGETPQVLVDWLPVKRRRE